jgi:lipopolysaccharide transport system permease protein
MVRIEPQRRSELLSLRELWEFGDLLLILATRDVKLRYKQTALGVVWVILQPLLPALIFAAILTYVVRPPPGDVPYLLFVYAALVPWLLLAGIVQRASSSLVESSALVTKVYFPRVLVPLASAFAVLVDFAVSVAIFAVLLAVHGVMPTSRLLAFVVAACLAFLLGSGLGVLLAALNVYYRDLVHALPFMIQVWLYGSPVLYSASALPERWQVVLGLNPMTGIVELTRWATIGTPGPPLLVTVLSIIISIGTFLVGLLVFRRIESRFADVI